LHSHENLVTTTSVEALRNKDMMRTEMVKPKQKLLFTKSPHNKTFKAIQNITKNLDKLNNYSKANWSQRDLSKKLLSAPSNISRNYSKHTNNKFNENLNKKHVNSQTNFEGLTSGSPYKKENPVGK
jgi:hypothetical protein